MRYDNFDRVEMGERITWLAEKKQWTMGRLAEKLNISDGALSMKIRGKRPFSANELLVIADTFDITLDELVRGVETENVTAHRATGLSKNAIHALCMFSLGDKHKRKALDYALSFPQALDAIARYICFSPAQKGYYLSEKVSEDGKLIHCSMSPAVYKSVLGQNVINMLDEIRTKEHFSKSYWKYDYQDYDIDDYLTEEELLMAESDEAGYEDYDADDDFRE